MRQSLLQNAIRPARARVFAHLSPEHTYASWHGLPRIVSNSSALLELINAIKHEFRPRLLTVVPDDELVATSRLWAGPLQGDSGQQSVLMLRWLHLLDAVRTEEAIRSALFRLVLRLRPDAVLQCSVPADWSVGSATLSPYRALLSHDFAAVMGREAATIALSAYIKANSTPGCRLKVELCVPAQLLAHNVSVGEMQPGASLVRPLSICNSTTPSSLGCGRLALTRALNTRAPIAACSSSTAKPRNITARMDYWIRRRGAVGT